MHPDDWPWPPARSRRERGHWQDMDTGRQGALPEGPNPSDVEDLLKVHYVCAVSSRHSALHEAHSLVGKSTRITKQLPLVGGRTQGPGQGSGKCPGASAAPPMPRLALE